MGNQQIVYKGPSFCMLLGLVFIVLKLCNVITWSWLWVTAPLWIPAGLCVAALAIIGLILGIVAITVIWK